MKRIFWARKWWPFLGSVVCAVPSWKTGRGGSGNHVALWLSVFAPTKYSFGSLLGSFPICTLTTNNSLPLMLAAASSCPNKIHELFGGDCCPVGYQLCWECRLSSCVPPLLPHASSHFLHCLLGRKKVYFPQWTGEEQLVKRCLPCYSFLDSCAVKALIKVHEFERGCLFLCSHHLFQSELKTYPCMHPSLTGMHIHSEVHLGWSLGWENRWVRQCQGSAWVEA